jgi:hypothetical protein
MSSRGRVRTTDTVDNGGYVGPAESVHKDPEGEAVIRPWTWLPTA